MVSPPLKTGQDWKGEDLIPGVHEPGEDEKNEKPKETPKK